MPTLLTMDELLDRCRISKRHLYDLMKEGRAPRAVRLGGRRLYDPADVAAWIETMKEERAAA